MAAPPVVASKDIVELLLRDGFVNREQVERAQREAKSNGYGVSYNLVKLGVIQELDLTKILAKVSSS